MSRYLVVTLRPPRCWVWRRRFHHWRLGAHLVTTGLALRSRGLVALGLLCVWHDRVDLRLHLGIG